MNTAGATGRPVALLLQYLVDEAARIAAEQPTRVARGDCAGQGGAEEGGP